MAARPDENYTIRRQVFKFFGAGFDIYGSTGEMIGHCHQKAFKLKEDLRIYTDKTKSEELLVITTPKVIDFSAKYDVKLPTGESIGAIQRKGLKSMLRDTWLVFNAEGREIAKLTAGSNGALDPADYERTVEALMSGGSDPVISAKPEGAWTHMITDKAL